MRRPPMLGVVGVDFGTKHAICFVLEKRQQDGQGGRTVGLPEDDFPPPAETCDPSWCSISQITIQATLSGTLNHKDDGCGGGASFDISSITDTNVCTYTSGPTCLSSCSTDETAVTYECDPECDPFTGDEHPVFHVVVNLVCPGADGEDWFLNLNGGISDVGEVFICNKQQFVGGDLILEVNLGPDPSGTHTFSFDDPTSGSAHFDVTVVVTP